MNKPGNTYALELFEPAYQVTLDEIYHSHWVARKRQHIGFLREAVKHFWPHHHPSQLIHVTGTNGKATVTHYWNRDFPKIPAPGQDRMCSIMRNGSISMEKC